jgi:hypothetical protein
LGIAPLVAGSHQLAPGATRGLGTAAETSTVPVKQSRIVKGLACVLVAAMNSTMLAPSETAALLQAFQDGSLGVSFGIAGELSIPTAFTMNHNSLQTTTFMAGICGV